MTAYNQERYIAEAIESVIYQTTKVPMELIIGEDHSTDKTLDICLHYKDRHPRLIGVYPRHQNLGVTRNTALTWAECRGDYIAMLDGDDYWTTPTKLQTQYEFLLAHPDHSMCFTKAETEPGSSFGPFVWPPNGAKWQLHDILVHNAMANCSVMYRRAFPRLPDWMNGGFCDISLHALHALNGPIGYIPESMAVHRINTGGNFDNKPLTERLVRAVPVYETLAEHLPRPYSDRCYQYLVLISLELAVFRSHRGDPRKYLNRMSWPYRATVLGLIAKTAWRFAFHHYGKPK